MDDLVQGPMAIKDFKSRRKMQGKLNFFTLVFVLIGLVLMAGPVLAAQSNKLSGKLYSVDSQANTVTIKGANGTLSTVTISTITKVTRNKKQTDLRGLVLGDRITAVFDNSQNPVKLKSKGPAVSAVSGPVTHVSSRNGIVTIGTRDVKASSKTMIGRNGKPASLRSLTLLDIVTAHVKNHGSSPSSSDDDAEDIQAEGPDESDVSGSITNIDTTNNTVTITPTSGSPVTVNVTSNTEIEVNGEDGTINDLAVGMFVQAEYDPVTFEAFGIEAENEAEEGEIEGTITDVNVNASTVTIQDESGNSVTLTVDASTEIERDDEPAFITDLQVGDSAEAEYDSVTLIAHQIEAESADEGDDDGSGEQ
jgi:Cu/Ag efflux protein CusF